MKGKATAGTQDAQRRLTGVVRTVFELHSYHGDQWLQAKVADDLRQLEPMAAQLVDRGEVDGVRIIRRRYHVDHDFDSMVIIRKRLRGGVVENDPLQWANAGRDSSWCDSPDDFMGDAQRQAMRALFSRYLDENRLTPLEILNHEGLARSLDNAGTLVQGALQRLASRQVRGTQQSAVTRMKELMALVDDGLARLAARGRETPPEPLSPTTFKAVADRAAQKTAAAGGKAADTRAVLYRAVAAYLIGCKSWVEKLDRLFSLFSPDFGVAEARILDSMAAEIMASPLALKELAGESSDRLGLILNAIDLYVGHLVREDAQPPGVRTLSALLAQGVLPRTMAELRLALLRHLYARLPLRAGNSVQQEMVGMDTIMRHLAERTPALSRDEEVLDVLAGGAERLIQPEAMAELMGGGRGVIRRIDALMGLLAVAPGAKVRAKLVPYLRSLIVVDDIVRDVGCAGNRLDAIRPLSEIANRILASPLPSASSHELVDILDAGLFDILRADVMSNQAMPFTDRLLVLIRHGALLPEGRARTFAGEMLTTALKRPEFILHYLERFPNAADKRAAYMQLCADIKGGRLVADALIPQIGG